MSWAANSEYTYDGSANGQAQAIWDTLNFGNSANSLDEGAKQACYLRGLLSELGFEQSGSMALYNDNQSSIALANRSVGGKLRHSRHLEIKIHSEFVQFDTILQMACQQMD